MVGILGANSVSGGGYEIDNSIRYNDGDSPYLSKTFSGSNAYGRVFTLSFWIKRSAISLDQYIFHARSADSQGNFARINFNADDTFQFRGYNKTYIKTNRKFRDPNAWYHIVLAVNTNDSTAGNRIKFYVNGILEPDLQTDTNPDASEFLIFGSDRPHFIGVANISGNKTEHFDGYYSEFNFIDGTQKDVTDFGEFNDNGVWIPKKYTGAYSTSGFYLQFKETGTGTDASGIGADTSGNDNHFAVTNLAATDVTTDTPTNNFATLNPLQITNTNQFLTEGNTQHATTSGSNWLVNNANIAVNKGKWYAEAKLIDATYTALGFMELESTADSIASMNTNNTSLGNIAGGWAIGDHYSNIVSKNLSNLVTIQSNSNLANNDICMFAMDLDNQKLYWGRNGSWFTSSDPAAGTNPIFTNITDGKYYVFSSGVEKATVAWNFGNPAYANSSSASDANGYGDFEYAPPSGFYSLCTKNLGEFG